MIGGTRGAVLRGALWMGGARVLVRSLGLLSTLVLARLLTPEDFGLVAVATGIVAFLTSATQFGFSHALIHYQDADDTDFATAWTLNVLRASAVTVIALVAAYPTAVATGDERIVSLVAALALSTFIGECASTRFVIFEKALRFDALFRLMTATKVSGVVGAVTLAVLWESYWALVFGTFLTNLTRAVLTFIMAPGRVWFTLRSWRKLFRFSAWLSGAEIMGAMANRLDPLILGLFAATPVVGFLHMTRELTWTTFNEIAAPLRRVLFPALSRYTAGGDAFRQAYVEAMAGLVMVLAPVSAGLALTAGDAIPLLLGPQWGTAILPIQMLAAALVLSIPGRVAQSAAMAAGQTQLIFYRTLLVLPVKLTCFVFGAYIYGLIGAVGGIVAGMLFETALHLCIGARVARVPFLAHLWAPRRSWLALAVMCVAVLAVNGLLPGAEAPLQQLGRLALAVVVGASTYTAAHYAAWLGAGRQHGPDAMAVEIVESFVRRIPGIR